MIADFIILLFLILFSAFFSGSETAFMNLKVHRKSMPSYLKLILKDEQLFLISILSANTIVNISIAVISTYLTSDIFKKYGFEDSIYLWILEVFIVGLIIFLELLVVIGGWKYKGNFIPLTNVNLNSELSNTHALGNILYTDYIHLFQVSGMILLVAMIGAITLTFTKRENIKRQNYFSQIERDKASSVSLVEVESDKGVKLDD